ncbi:MAG TPA: 3-deoxy-7-phosphoheptulonate synthase [Planctomycetaceae bacterium]|nr:3-deoxy-7-phosphoheptulonate synthase [Planctomycetaceae bacterium]HRF02006.1 3-deoxy-7-phosphoheptulonate synthase [Pirellulaceae bacterium]
MLIVMQTHASGDDIAEVCRRIESLGLKAHPMPGATRTAIGITGNIDAIDARSFEALSGVRELVRVTKPYKLASREMHADDTVVPVAGTRIGPGTFTVIAGPCSVENESMAMEIAEFLRERGVRLFRGGVFKPRTSPYAFQGLEDEGLRILERVRERTGVGIVTEVMEPDQVERVEQASDILQIGTRNMQNFPLLKRVGKAQRPVLLKRGMSATLEEWLMAAEYVLAGGNKQVILCERGIRTFADHTRNTLDLSVIPPAKQFSHLPILVDPSHGTGKRAYVHPMALAGLAAGADGLIVEIHPKPETAMSDGAQTLTLEQFDVLLTDLRRLAEALGRTVV